MYQVMGLYLHHPLFRASRKHFIAISGFSEDSKIFDFVVDIIQGSTNTFWWDGRN